MLAQTVSRVEITLPIAGVSTRGTVTTVKMQNIKMGHRRRWKLVEDWI